LELYGKLHPKQIVMGLWSFVKIKVIYSQLPSTQINVVGREYETSFCGTIILANNTQPMAAVISLLLFLKYCFKQIKQSCFFHINNWL
jgi:hypothetical protein